MTCIDLKNINFTDTNNVNLINIGISNRHLHISQEHLEKLFGEGYQLTNLKDLSQPGQYACNETVHVVGHKSCIQNVRILGPVRKQTQVELAKTDAIKIGIKAPLRSSGDLAGSPGCVLVGPCGYVVLEEGVIIAKPHIHLNTSQGEAIGVKDKELVDVYFKGPKEGALFNVEVRVHETFDMDLHLDTDEANTFQLKNKDKALLVKKA
ncbi:MAG: phosphate propanoyltransferase [Bacillota bacterium]|jgi:putative phosphotransacetylase